MQRQTVAKWRKRAGVDFRQAKARHLSGNPIYKTLAIQREQKPIHILQARILLLEVADA
ncbi:MAG: hypothetical protein WBN97_03725 [Parvibaculum sp.]